MGSAPTRQRMKVRAHSLGNSRGPKLIPKELKKIYWFNRKKEGFVSKNGNPKIRVFYLIFKKWINLGKGFFLGKKIILNKPNTQKYPQVFVVICQKLKSEKCRLRTPSSYEWDWGRLNSQGYFLFRQDLFLLWHL